MKIQLFLTSLLISTLTHAFPAYNKVSCEGKLNGHELTVEYNKNTHILVFGIDGNKARGLANESDNRIYTDSEYDQHGNKLSLEILSNAINWKATFNIYVNDEIAVTTPMSCKKIGLLSEPLASVSSILSTLQTPKN